MGKATQNGSLVTLVIVPRERFSAAKASLESIFRDDDYPFELVYVDGGSPPALARHLREEARKRNFTLIRTDDYLSPNKARNIGLAHVQTKYVVFLDNDVFVTRGWLQKLIECAEQTGADVVSPLVCEGSPLHKVVHCAGGETGVRIENKNGKDIRKFIEKIHKQGRTVAEVRPTITREKTGLAEFHAMLVRKSVFDRIGPLDEGMINTKEHCDLCTLVEQSGGEIWLEPDSIVTYDFTGRKFSDLGYFMLRWSDQWELDSLDNLKAKYELDDSDEYFKARVKNRGWRRRHKIWKPLLQKLFLGLRLRKLEDLIVAIDCIYNRRLTDRYARQAPHIKPRIVHQPAGRSPMVPAPGRTSSIIRKAA